MYRMKCRVSQVSDEKMESILDEVITKLIARDLDVEPEKITPEFMSNWRDEHLYPDARVNLNTKYGGYNGGGRTALTRREVAEHARQAVEFLHQFRD
jgi:hypothetical protein